MTSLAADWKKAKIICSAVKVMCKMLKSGANGVIDFG
jgi:hypothetical protein